MALLRQEVSYPREVQLQRGVSGRAEVDAVNLFAAVSEICRDRELMLAVLPMTKCDHMSCLQCMQP